MSASAAGSPHTASDHSVRKVRVVTAVCSPGRSPPRQVAEMRVSRNESGGKHGNVWYQRLTAAAWCGAQALPAATRPIEWRCEQSIAAHSTVNALRNAAMFEQWKRAAPRRAGRGCSCMPRLAPRFSRTGKRSQRARPAEGGDADGCQISFADESLRAEIPRDWLDCHGDNDSESRPASPWSPGPQRVPTGMPAWLPIETSLQDQDWLEEEKAQTKSAAATPVSEHASWSVRSAGAGEGSETKQEGRPQQLSGGHTPGAHGFETNFELDALPVAAGDADASVTSSDCRSLDNTLHPSQRPVSSPKPNELAILSALNAAGHRPLVPPLGPSKLEPREALDLQSLGSRYHDVLSDCTVSHAASDQDPDDLFSICDILTHGGSFSASTTS